MLPMPLGDNYFVYFRPAGYSQHVVQRVLRLAPDKDAAVASALADHPGAELVRVRKQPHRFSQGSGTFRAS